jgi:hypothetical protein
MPACPWLVVLGDADELIPADETVALVSALVPVPTLELLPGVGHFFHGELNSLREHVQCWFDRVAPAAAP